MAAAGDPRSLGEAAVTVPELVARYQLEPLKWPPELVAEMLRWTTPLRGTAEYDGDWLIARGVIALGRWGEPTKLGQRTDCLMRAT